MSKQSWEQQVARGSVAAFVLVLVVVAMTSSVGGVGKPVSAAIAMGFGVLGFVLAVVALVAFGVTRRAGVFSYALADLRLNGARTLCWGSNLVTTCDESLAEALPAAGWAGAARVPSGSGVSVIQAPLDGRFAALTTGSVVAILSVDNQRGTQALVVDAARPCTSSTMGAQAWRPTRRRAGAARAGAAGVRRARSR